MTLSDVMARLVRALEALQDGERDFAEEILDDLKADVWKAIEAEERGAGT